MTPIVRGTLAALIMTAPALSACDILSPRGDVLRDQLRRNEQLWLSAGPPANYSMNVLLVAGVDSEPDLVRVHVEGGAIVGGTYVENDQPVPAAVLADYTTVSGLFDIIRNALDRRAPAIAINYHHQYGYPEEIFIDFDGNRTSDDLYIQVTEMDFNGS
ncbi:MAG TPA: DUF6174 domain-containing protein [Longimicrobiales bacterium]|nr:DUF6174 domain-containing protein [Longimicrobiales bacterium]